MLGFLSICCGASAQKTAIKTNLLYDATTTVNLGMEFKIGEKTTLDIPVNVNLWSFHNNDKLKHYLVQPEFRWWACEPFTGHFWGVHAHAGFFNVGGVSPLNIIKDYRHEGWLAGAGASYGYNFIIGGRWSVETTIGAGYAYIDYERYRCGNCGAKLKDDKRHYFGLTKLGVTLVFLIK